MKVNIILEENDIKKVVIDTIDIDNRPAGYDHVQLSDIDVYDIIDDDDIITIEVFGNFDRDGYSSQSGKFEGKLIINKDDALLEEIANKKIIIDEIDIDLTGGNDSYSADINDTLSENVEDLRDAEDEAAGDAFGCAPSVLQWKYVLNNEKLIPELKKVLKNEFPNESFDELNVDELIKKLDELEVLDADEYDPSFNEDYDDTIGKVILPYFIKEFTDIDFTDDRESWNINNVHNDDTDFGDMYILLYD